MKKNKETQAPQMQAPQVTQRDIEILVFFSDGKKLAFKMKDPKAMMKAVKTTDPYNHIHKLEDAGIISGYVPVLTEKGKRIVEALSLMKTASDEPLEDIFK